MALSGFAPAAYALMSVNATSENVSIPGSSPATALVTNVGEHTVFVLLGSSSVSVTPLTGVAISPGASLPLTVASNTNIAAITLQGPSAINIATGT